MFYYYGRKKQIARHYPSPRHGTIIEPFAGSAAYSLHGDNWKRRVILIERDPEVVTLWKFLQSVSEKAILHLPSPKRGDDLRAFGLTRVEQHLISLHCATGTVGVRNIVGNFSRWEPGRRYIVESLHKIRHWEVSQGDYRSAPSLSEATYFIDPPYRTAGSHYRFGPKTLDYEGIGRWAVSLPGQVIVCEGRNHGEWLPFKPMGIYVNNGNLNGGYKSGEYIYLQG